MLSKMMSWSVSGLYTIFRTKTVLKIPLPAKLYVFRTYIEDGDLCVVLRPLRVFHNGCAVPVKEHVTGVCAGSSSIEKSSSIYTDCDI